MKKLNDIRKYLKNTFMGKEQLRPESRVTQQVMDLQLLKYAMKQNGEVNAAVWNAIDSCIEGFIWLYQNGGTHQKLPDIINTDIYARQYYEHFSQNWSILQDYMRTHMGLMEV